MAQGSLIVLVHGFWHGTWCWSEVIEELAVLGRQAIAFDTAGFGLDARRPAAEAARPWDPVAFATEPSPVAAIGLDPAAERLTAKIRRVAGGDSVVLVGHSMGGPVIQRVGEQTPELVAHLVYLTAFMPASGTPALAYLDAPEAEGELVSKALAADPTVVGALRLNTSSADPSRDLLRNTFYGDVDPVTAAAAIALLSPDSPVAMSAEVTDLSNDGWGRVLRTYVICEQDFAIRPASQRRFVAEADAAFPDNPTRVVTLDASHSPFLSMPDRVAAVLADIPV